MAGRLLDGGIAPMVSDGNIDVLHGDERGWYI
jgi:hypothetical protein